MEKHTFARRVVRLAGLLGIAVFLAACSSSTAPELPEEPPKDEPKDDPKDGVVSRYSIGD